MQENWYGIQELSAMITRYGRKLFGTSMGKGNSRAVNMLPFPAAVVLMNPKHPHNLAAAIRACSCFGVNNLRWTGTRVALDTMERLPREMRMKDYDDVDWQVDNKPLDEFTGRFYTPVCVELVPGAENLASFNHPAKAVYVFGPEDGEVPQVIRKLCHRFVAVPSKTCLNLAATINVVLYDRLIKTRYNWNVDMAHDFTAHDVVSMSKESVDFPGWDGK